MAGHVEQQCVAEWRLIDEGNISRSPSFTRTGFATRDAF